MDQVGNKRTSDECNVSEIVESKRVKVHGVVTTLSPVKKGKASNRKYFDAHISDGKEVVRVVSFSPSLRPAIDSSVLSKSSISMMNCKVQMEKGVKTIFLNEHTTIESSPRKFVIPDSHNPLTNTIDLCELSSLANNTTINVTIKVIKVSPPEIVKTKADKSYEKQDCVVGDSSGCCRVVLWENDVNRLVCGSSYKLSSVVVRSFSEVNYLSVGMGSQIISVEDIGVVSSIQSGDIDRVVTSREIEGEIIAVRCIEYTGCSECKVKIDVIDDLVGECPKCGLMVKLNRCSKLFTANIRVEDADKKKHDIKLFHDNIIKIAKNDAMDVDMIQKCFLAQPKLKFKVNNKNIAFAVEF